MREVAAIKKDVLSVHTVILQREEDKETTDNKYVRLEIFASAFAGKKSPHWYITQVHS